MSPILWTFLTSFSKKKSPILIRGKQKHVAKWEKLFEREGKKISLHKNQNKTTKSYSLHKLH